MIAIKKILQRVVAGCIFLLPALLAKSQSLLTTGIRTAAHATHIASISKDTIVVITGSTYRFTVDTPEDQGLVTTTPTVTELLSQLTSPNGLKQQYLVTYKTGNQNQTGEVTTGDRLIVT